MGLKSRPRKKLINNIYIIMRDLEVDAQMGIGQEKFEELIEKISIYTLVYLDLEDIKKKLKRGNISNKRLAYS